jgi:Tfp pilus assembly protein PilF
VELAPDSPRAQDTLAWVYYRQRNFTAATEFLKKAVSREPTAPRQYHLGFAHLNNGQRTLASTQIEAAFEKDPDPP